MQHYEAVKNGSRLIFTVVDGIVVEAYSPTHECFNPIDLMGQPWTEVRKMFLFNEFTIHTGC